MTTIGMMTQVTYFFETTLMLSAEVANNITDKKLRELVKKVVGYLSMEHELQQIQQTERARLKYLL